MTPPELRFSHTEHHEPLPAPAGAAALSFSHGGADVDLALPRPAGTTHIEFVAPGWPSLGE